MNILDIAIAKKLAGGGGGSGTDNYNDLSNLPKINDTTLSGNKSSSALGLQSEINSDSKLASDLVDDTNQDNKFVTSTEKNTWNAKQNAIDADHKLSSDLVDDANKTNKFVTSTEKNTWNAKQNAIDSDHKLSSDLVDDANKTNKFVTSTEKNTWNAKQNAIDADHKLSSSLVSFTTAEAAALASGIDSSKVGQISTNQTNILYALEVGAKNLFRWDKWVSDCTVVGGTKTISSGVMTLTSSSTNCYTEYEGSAYPDVEIPVKENEQYVMTWENWRISGSSRGTVYVVFVGSTGAATASASAEVKKIEFTTPTGTTELRVYIKQTTDALIENYSDFMICSKAIWDTLGHNYQPPSVSNYDLTALEAEDRKNILYNLQMGVKNLLNYAGASLSSGTGGQFIVDGDPLPHNLPIGKYVFRINRSATASATLILRDSSDNIVGQATVSSGSGVGYSSTITTTGIATNYRIAVVSPAAVTFSEIMLCTENAWNQSQDYQPFAESNSELTQLEQQDRNALVEVVDSGAKNKLKNNAVTSTDGEAVFTVNGDGSVSVYTTAETTETRILHLVLTGDNVYVDATDIVSGVPTYNNKIGIGWGIGAYGNTDAILGDNPTPKPIGASGVIRYMAITIASGVSISSSSPLTFYPMVCSAADWKISQNYAPFALPNTDLTQLEAEDRTMLRELALDTSSQMTSGSLDDITSSSFVICDWQVTGKPAGLTNSAWGFVRTTIADSNTALQEFFAFSAQASDNGVSFVRVKQGGTWQSWKQITNA